MISTAQLNTLETLRLLQEDSNQLSTLASFYYGTTHDAALHRSNPMQDFFHPAGMDTKEFINSNSHLKLSKRLQPINPFGEQPLESLAIALYYLRHCEKPPPNSRIFQ